MKKNIWIFLIAGLLTGLQFSPIVAMDLSGVNITGKISTVLKSQDSYQTPLDMASERQGANYRANQHFRGYGEFILSHGNLGKSEWFGAAQILFDANDPDNDPNNNKSDDFVDVGYSFIMYRPFEIQGERPFGIMAGVLPFKATSNASYFHFFKGDKEEDFIYYTSTALTEAPGIGMDFHISKDTGFGIGFANGVDDGSKLGALMSSDSAENIIVWGEAKQWNFGLNAGLQIIEGEGDASKKWTTPAGNELYEYRQQYGHILFNTALTYTFNIGDFNFVPMIGYQLISGEECRAVPGYDPRDIEQSSLGYGLKIGTNFFNIPGELSMLYNEAIDQKEFNGIASLPKGSIEADTGIPGLSGLIPVEGTGEGMLAMMEVKSSIHLDYAFKVSKNVEVGIFYYDLKTTNDKTKEADYIKGQLANLGDPVLIDGIAQQVSTQLKQLEWTDTTSYGLFCNLYF